MRIIRFTARSLACLLIGLIVVGAQVWSPETIAASETRTLATSGFGAAVYDAHDAADSPATIGATDARGPAAGMDGWESLGRPTLLRLLPKQVAPSRAGMDSFLDNGATVHHSGTATAIGDDANTLTDLGRSQGSAGHDVIVHGQVVDGQANFVTNGMPTHTQQIADAVLSNPAYVPGSPVQLVTCDGACGLADELSQALGGARVTASPHLVDLDPAAGLLRSW